MKKFWRLLSTLLNPRSDVADLKPMAAVDEGGHIMEAPNGLRSGVPVKSLLSNPPLIFGGVIVLGLFLVVLLGPLWAPINPYIAGQHVVAHYDAEKEVWINPPLEPSLDYPLGTNQWGQDILSMLLYGARNTLIACAFITMVRVILGTILGAMAGWNEGSLIDQMVMGGISVITSVPLLVSSMLLVYALDVRRGLPVFIVALSVVGWTEISQYIRSEFLVLRKKPFIEGARAVGTRNLSIAVRHVLPNIMPQLLVISFLELGAVLMLLGELSFVGVFIGGGGQLSLGDEITGVTVVTYSQVPEWGAMLAEGYRWLRAKPFIVFPPALAFFIAVVGFNSFGEGLRRLIERHHINTNFLLRKRMVLGIAALTFATAFIINNTGPAPWFARVGEAFDGDAAYQHVEALTQMQGRGAGQEGAYAATDYITEKFIQYGLKPGWQSSEYRFPMEVVLADPKSQPELSLVDPQGNTIKTYRHNLDFGFDIQQHAGGGSAEGKLTYVGFTKSIHDYEWQDFIGLDLEGKIILIVEGNAPVEFPTEAMIRGAKGVLRISSDDPDSIRSQIQLSNEDGLYLEKPTLPVFRIRPGVAQEMLGLEGTAFEELIDPASAPDGEQTGPGWYTRPLNGRVRMSVDLTQPEMVEVPAILGFLPGSDYNLSDELLVLYANYDGLPREQNGTIYPGANHNASGIGVLLEIARTWQDQGLNTRRPVLFIAWGGGELTDPGVNHFLEVNSNYRHLPNINATQSIQPRIIFELDRLGAGMDGLAVHPNSNTNLATLLEKTMSESGVEVLSAEEYKASDTQVNAFARVSSTAWISFAWGGPDLPADQDTLDKIDPDKLRAVGEPLVQVLTTIVRQNSYLYTP
jgi:peptide/nickel transport system permease protein